MTTRDEALAALAEHRANDPRRRRLPDQHELQLVADCLNADPPATWRQIGEAIGKPASNTHRRYARFLDVTVKRQVRVKTSTD